MWINRGTSRNPLPLNRKKIGSIIDPIFYLLTIAVIAPCRRARTTADPTFFVQDKFAYDQYYNDDQYATNDEVDHLMRLAKSCDFDRFV